MELHAYDHFAVDRLVQDLNTATEGWDWSQSFKGHSLSLPARDDVHPVWQDHAKNNPFANRLARCPYFRQIFDSFECEKVSFRLLRRPAGTSYPWHTDKDKGESVVRFQIPIVTHSKSVLVVTNFDEELPTDAGNKTLFQRVRRRCRREVLRALGKDQAKDQELAEARAEAAKRAEAFDNYATFRQSFPGHFREHVLEAGVLYYFDTSKVHNLINQASGERITLVVDCLENKWLRTRYPAIVEELIARAA